MAYEIVDSDEVSCPAELLTITVPKCDAAFDRTCTGHSVMPYERIKYDTATGQSPNNPRRQVYIYICIVIILDTRELSAKLIHLHWKTVNFA